MIFFILVNLGYFIFSSIVQPSALFYRVVEPVIFFKKHNLSWYKYNLDCLTEDPNLFSYVFLLFDRFHSKIIKIETKFVYKYIYIAGQINDIILFQVFIFGVKLKINWFIKAKKYSS